MTGHSGCKIELYNNIIKKISKDINYNERLKSQCLKQDKYKHFLIKTPKIHNIGYTKDGNFYFEMEYIRGINFSQYCIHNDVNKCKKIIKL